MVVADAPAFGQPGLYVHLLVKLRQAFAQTVTHNHPAKEILRGFERIGKVRHTDLEYTLVGAAAIIRTTASQHNGQCCTTQAEADSFP